MPIPGNKLIVVDIQPTYADKCSYFINEFISSLLHYNGRVLYYWLIHFLLIVAMYKDIKKAKNFIVNYLKDK